MEGWDKFGTKAHHSKRGNYANNYRGSDEYYNNSFQQEIDLTFVIPLKGVWELKILLMGSLFGEILHYMEVLEEKGVRMVTCMPKGYAFGKFCK